MSSKYKNGCYSWGNFVQEIKVICEVQDQEICVDIL